MILGSIHIPTSDLIYFTHGKRLIFFFKERFTIIGIIFIILATGENMQSLGQDIYTLHPSPE